MNVPDSLELSVSPTTSVDSEAESEVVLSVPHVSTALLRPAAEGARMVALHWLTEMYQARELWSAAVDDVNHSADREAAEQNAASALHRTRVSLRRLRATLREHRASLDLRIDRKSRRALRRIGRATNVVRDRDVQRAWLDAERDGLSSAAQVEAAKLSARLRHDAGDAHTLVTRVLDRHFDPFVERVARSLRTYTVTRMVGAPPDETLFADHLATRIEQSGNTLLEELRDVSDIDAQDLLHRIRIRLKRQRAMLAPFSRIDPAVGAWYALATRGQDLLGAMRDAMLLADVASQDGHDALAPALRSIALGHFEAFHDQWCEGRDAIGVAIQQAARVLRAEAAKERSASVLREGSPAHDRASVTSVSLDQSVPMEIERKYLLHGLPPEAAMAMSMRIDQGWLPGTVLRERLRRSTMHDGTEVCTRTVKFGPMGARIELEEATDPTLFAALWPLTIDARIRKRRHIVRNGELTWEIDVFLDRDLVIAEVELQSESQIVPIPDWLAPFVVREVTHDPAYLNSEMAQRDVASPELAIR